MRRNGAAGGSPVEDAPAQLAGGTSGTAEAVAETRRTFELNVNPGLALEALFIRLRRELASPLTS